MLDWFLSGMQLTRTVTVFEVVWAIVSAIALYFAVQLLRYSRADFRAAKERGTSIINLRIANRIVRSDKVRVVTLVIYTVLALYTMTRIQVNGTLLNVSTVVAVSIIGLSSYKLWDVVQSYRDRQALLEEEIRLIDAEESRVRSIRDDYQDEWQT